jgi:hypothetical protein
VLACAIMGGQPRLDCLVAGASYPLPFLVEIWVLGSVPGGTILSQVIGFATALAVRADLGGHRCRLGWLAALILLTVS